MNKKEQLSYFLRLALGEEVKETEEELTARLEKDYELLYTTGFLPEIYYLEEQDRFHYESDGALRHLPTYVVGWKSVSPSEPAVVVYAGELKREAAQCLKRTSKAKIYKSVVSASVIEKLK